MSQIVAWLPSTIYKRILRQTALEISNTRTVSTWGQPQQAWYSQLKNLDDLEKLMKVRTGHHSDKHDTLGCEPLILQGPFFWPTQKKGHFYTDWTHKISGWRKCVYLHLKSIKQCQQSTACVFPIPVPWFGAVLVLFWARELTEVLV